MDPGEWIEELSLWNEMANFKLQKEKGQGDQTKEKSEKCIELKKWSEVCKKLK